jgi:cellulose synthase/poly-beta-1,6-N-acetylglucosamine synthase-like glycosyltransferase
LSSLGSKVDYEAPPISPVPEGIQRPLWSVMIPTFNCALYLRHTLQSVLQQDPGPDQMEIEVIDDCSTKDDPEAVVREMGGGRVRFHRKPKNAGAIANFNTCIERSRGTLVHILHGDDSVLPGFYTTVGGMAADHPECALYATRCFFMDEEGHYTGVTGRLPELESAPSADAKSFFSVNPLQFAGVAVRRAFYEKQGGFLPQLVHTADWEMWARAVANGRGLVNPSVLAMYRVFAANDTGRLMRTAENLADEERLCAVLHGRHPELNVAELRRHIFCKAFSQEERFARLDDREAVAANRAFRRARHSWSNLGFRLKRLAVRAARRLGV